MIVKQQNKNAFSFIAYKIKPTHNLKQARQHKKKPTLFTMDPQQTNPVYNHLRHQRNNRHIMKFILNFKTQPRQRPKSICRVQTYSPNFSAFARSSQSDSSRQLQKFRSQGENIFLRADRMTTQLKRNKKKINILDQYNDLVDRYCDIMPKIKSQDDKEALIAHRQIQKLCAQQYVVKEEDIGKRASLFKQYEEPKINNIHFLKKQAKVTSNRKPQTIQKTQVLLKRNNTSTF